MEIKIYCCPKEKMPRMSGLELVEMVKQYSMDIAVVLLTGFSEFEYARRVIKSGVYPEAFRKYVCVREREDGCQGWC